VRLFPTGHRQGRPRVSVQETEGAAHGRRNQRDDRDVLRHRAAFGGESGRSQDGAVRALRRDIGSPGARREGRAVVRGEDSSRRLAELFNGFVGPRKVYWDQAESNKLRLGLAHRLKAGGIIYSPAAFGLNMASSPTY
ncbi:hypothetical protein THAOC_01699, partial [Thalassiosira oceanica]